MQRGFGCIVDASEYIRHDTRKAANLDYRAFGLDQQGCKGLTHSHDGEDIDFEGLVDFIEVDIEGRDGVVSARIVDEIVKSAAGGKSFYLGFQRGNAVRFVNFETESLDAAFVKVGYGCSLAGCRKDAKAWIADSA